MSQEATLKVDFGQVGEYGDFTVKSSVFVEQKLADLRSSVARLNELWQGQANEAYQAAQTKFNATADDLQRILGDMGKHILNSNDAFQSTETSNRNKFGS